jgi:hypothetical protein
MTEPQIPIISISADQVPPEDEKNVKIKELAGILSRFQLFIFSF